MVITKAMSERTRIEYLRKQYQWWENRYNSGGYKSSLRIAAKYLNAFNVAVFGLNL